MSEDNQTFGLHKNINTAAAIRNMCQTPGFKVLQEAFEEKVKKASKQILDPEMSDDDVKRKIDSWRK